MLLTPGLPVAKPEAAALDAKPQLVGQTDASILVHSQNNKVRDITAGSEFRDSGQGADSLAFFGPGIRPSLPRN